MQRLHQVAAGMIVLAAMTAACGGSNPSSQANCQTYSNGHSSPAPGTLTLSGMFYSNESVLLQYTVNGQNKQMPLTPATDRTQVTFTGLPSGSLEYDLVISCSDGQLDLGSRVYVIP